MKKYLSVSLVLATFFSFSQANAQMSSPLCSAVNKASHSGSCVTAPDDYTMQIFTFRLRKQDGTFLDFEGSATTVDFADADAGDSLGTWISNVQVPAGVYTAVSPILSPVNGIRGSATFADAGTCITAADGSAPASGTPAVYNADQTETRMDLVSGTDEVEGQSGTSLDFINGDGHFVVVDPTVGGFPITVNDGDTITFTFSIDPSEGLQFELDGAGNCTGATSGPVSVELAASID